MVYLAITAKATAKKCNMSYAMMLINVDIMRTKPLLDHLDFLDDIE